jgi:type II secretory pathway component PulF
MKLDELAYVNQQLAGMLRSGIPLEGALRQICETMHRGALQTELQALEADLAKGTPLREALVQRQLPKFYQQMLLVGAQSNDFPGLLTLLGDHYQRLHFTWTRLKGLLVYPLIVLGIAFAVSVLVAVMFTHFSREGIESMVEMSPGQDPSRHLLRLTLGLWAPVVLLGLICVATAGLLAHPRSRSWLKWRVPGYQEAGLSHLASAIALMLRNGCTLNQTLGLISQLETGSPTQPELMQWQARLAAGNSKFPELAAGGKVIPPLFVWLVASSGEDWAGGFAQAARVYYERALQRVETLLYAALPISVLALAFLIVGQIVPMLRIFTDVMRSLGDMGSVGP